ncbi:hypothetical protein [Burkholderia sp. BCC0419]|uniref:hypothetical protein n=1 Tax=Burkholderia sp. BCC0419 TaxID=486878 RepID=UPI003263E3F1
MTLSRSAIVPPAFALCLAIAACQTSGPAPVQPSPETASAPVPASSPPAAPIRGMGVAPHLAAQSHWAIGQCTTNGTVKVCN